jgi:hypothetical protein
MKLPEQDARLFYRLMGALLRFVNRRRQIHPELPALEESAEADLAPLLEVRAALYARLPLIDAFAAENPDRLCREELAIVRSWKRLRRGSFFLERYLKRHAIFIQDDAVYGVLGISRSLAEIIPETQLPVFLEAVLLPFKGRIVHDGFFSTPSSACPPGLRCALAETYREAARSGRILVSLEPSPPRESSDGRPPPKDWRPELEELAARVKSLRGSARHPAILTPAFSLVRASVEFARRAVNDPDDLKALYMGLKAIRRGLDNALTVLDREERARRKRS